jgi:hypothetical protein
VFRPKLVFVAAAVVFSLHRAEKIASDQNWAICIDCVLKILCEQIAVAVWVVPVSIPDKQHTRFVGRFECAS